MYSQRSGKTSDRDFGVYHYLRSLSIEKPFHGMAKAFLAAIISSFGLKALSNRSVQKFLKRISLRKSDREILSIKACLTQVRLNALSGKETPRGIKGMIMPRVFSQCKKRSVLLQYTRCSRALPQLSKKAEVQALTDQKERLTTPFNVPVPARLREVIDNFPKSPLGDPLPSDFVSNSSCLEATRREGGRLGLIDPNLKSIPELRYRLNISLKRGVSALSRVQEALPDLEDCIQSSVSPRCEALAIRELGGKVRIVTKHSSATVQQSYRGQRLLWKLLSDNNNIVVSETLKDPELGIIKMSRRRNRSRFVFSADLSAATDYLGWPIIRYIADHFGLPHDWVFPSFVDGTPVLRGTGMGLPCSWPVLSLAHYAICYVVDPGHDFRIKGDDLIALWSARQITRYKDLLKTVGLVLNEAKSVQDPIFGTFCEVTYRRVGNTLIRQRDYSLRSFVKDTPLAYDQWSMLIRHGVRVKELNRMFRFFHTRHVHKANQFKIPLYLPRKMGGMGYPPQTMTKSLSSRESAAVRNYHNGAPILYDEERLAGKLTQVYLDKLTSVRLIADGDQEAYAKLLKNYSITCARTSLMDRYTDPKLVHMKTNFSFSKLRKHFRKVSEGRPHPCTVEKAYDVLSRLGLAPNQGIDLLFGGWYSTKSSMLYSRSKLIGSNPPWRMDLPL